MIEKQNNSFNEDFCSFLEYHLCKVFKNSDDEEVKKLWCDGIIHETLNGSKQSAQDTRTIITTAFIGKNGQDRFEMTIHFGNKSLNNFLKDLDLKECVPSENNLDWMRIAIQSKKIDLFLD